MFLFQMRRQARISAGGALVWRSASALQGNLMENTYCHPQILLNNLVLRTVDLASTNCFATIVIPVEKLRYKHEMGS